MAGAVRLPTIRAPGGGQLDREPARGAVLLPVQFDAGQRHPAYTAVRSDAPAAVRHPTALAGSAPRSGNVFGASLLAPQCAAGVRIQTGAQPEQRRVEDRRQRGDQRQRHRDNVLGDQAAIFVGEVIGRRPDRVVSNTGRQPPRLGTEAGAVCVETILMRNRIALL